MDYKEKEYTGDSNPAIFYYKNVGFVRLFFKSSIFLICKLIPSIRIKNSIYRLMGVKIGKNVVISPYVEIDPFYPELITIEDNVIIGWGASIFTHEFTHKKIRKGKVHIKKNALIGGYSMIRSGVTIGESATISAKSFVNKDVMPNTVVGGIPAKIIEYSH